jgi:fructosamine-3-kinase
MHNWITNIVNHISATVGRNFSCRHRTRLGGGCINAAWRLSDEYSSFFVKLNIAATLDMFIAEFEGLQALHATGTVKIPVPLCYGVSEDCAYLVTEYLPLAGGIDYARLGEQLAAMHGHYYDNFGWHRNNTIGTTPQANPAMPDWIEFWRRHRLGYQLRLAADNGYGGELQTLGEWLIANCHHLFDGYRPQPSLLHGDLWSGNAAALPDGTPVIFDPAVYYGDREADLAMTELFGGFSPAFYSAYNSHSPLDPGYTVRKHFYNLYHILNHLNLFGGGYRHQAEQTMRLLLAELR